MFGRKTGLFAAMATAVLLLGGCGTDGTVTEEQARGWYNDMVNDRGVNGGANNGNWGAGVNGERNTYGMNDGTTLGNDIRNAWDNVKNDVNYGVNGNGVNGVNGVNRNGVNGTAANGVNGNGTVANGVNNNGVNDRVR